MAQPASQVSCDKRGYASKRAARNALRRHRGSMADLHAYLCPWCHLYHLGHRTPRKHRW